MKTKYVVIDTGMFIVPYIFSDLDTHFEFASKFSGEVLGAGFCYLTVDDQTGQPQYKVYGHSVSLNVVSRPEDADIINKYLLG